MANQKQLEIIKQDVEVWNAWRHKHSDIEIDLTDADLTDVDLSGTDLSKANLSRTNLKRADLNEANLRNANLSESNNFRADFSNADLSNADLSETDLRNTDFSGAILKGAILSGAILSYADFRFADLREADLRSTDLIGTNFSGANLSGTNLSNSVIDETSFGDVELSSCLGLETIDHLGPSHISTNTLEKSKGQIPVEFLRGCGLSDWEIESAKLYNPDLSNQEISELQYKIYDLRATRSIQVSPLFISYSHADSSFVDKLGKKLTEIGVRYWRDIHDMKSGRMEKQVDRALRLNPTVLVVLSKHSIKSDWVEHEVNSARELEKELNRDCLCPVALDDSWMSSPWDQRIMRQVKKYNILDFSSWQDKSTFGTTFKKLVDGLQLFYK